MIINAVNDPNIQPINRGGTGATTVEDALINLGVNDFVVEQGTSGIWTYRKWNSGIAECWGVQKETGGTYVAWGSIYSHDIGAVPFPSGLFKTVDFEAAHVVTNAGNLVSSINSDGGGTALSRNITCVRGTAVTGSYEFTARRYVIGTWK